MDAQLLIAIGLGAGAGAAFCALVGFLIARFLPRPARTWALLAGLFIGVLAGGVAGWRLFELGGPNPTRIESALRTDGELAPLVDAWRRNDPVAFNAFVQDLAGAVDRGEPPEALVARGRARLIDEARRRLPRLADRDVVGFATLVRDEFVVLAERRPAACHALVNNNASADLRGALTPEIIARERDLLARAFAAPAPDNLPALSQAEGAATIQRLSAPLVARFGADMALLSPDAQIEGRERRVCEISIAFYEQVLAMPGAQAAQLMRFLLLSS